MFYTSLGIRNTTLLDREIYMLCQPFRSACCRGKIPILVRNVHPFEKPAIVRVIPISESCPIFSLINNTNNTYNTNKYEGIRFIIVLVSRGREYLVFKIPLFEYFSIIKYTILVKYWIIDLLKRHNVNNLFRNYCTEWQRRL